MDWGKKEIENVASIFIKHGVMDHTTGCNLIRDEEQKVSSFQRPNFQQRSKRTTATYSPMVIIIKYKKNILIACIYKQ